MSKVNRNAIAYLSSALLLVFAACTSVRVPDEYVPEPQAAIVAYARDSNRMDLEAIDARWLTHVNYAFADVSPEHEMFLRNASDGVALLKISQDGSVPRELYSRVFLHDETDEIRLHGFGGNDQIIQYGDAADEVFIRIMAIDGNALVIDSSAFEGPARLNQRSP